MKAVLRILIVCILLSSIAMPTVGAYGVIVSRGDYKPTPIGPVGEIVTATPTIQWKMDWVKESNPQPSPSPQRLEFTVILYHNDKPIWESPSVQGKSGQSMYELQLPAGLIGPGAGPAEGFAWQVVAQFYNGSAPGRKSLSDMRLFAVRGGCSTRIETMVVPKVNNSNVLAGVHVNAYSNQNPNLLLGQVVTNAAGEGRMSFAICPIKTTERNFLSAARWTATKPGYRFEVVNGVKTSSDEWLRIVMRPAN